MGFFKRLFGKSSNSWVPRPFYENKTKADFREWFLNVPEWSILDTRITDILIDRMFGDPDFELFMHYSTENNLIIEYASLRNLLDSEGNQCAICPKVSQILYQKGVREFEKCANLLQHQSATSHEVIMEGYKLAKWGFETSILVEPDYLPPYYNLASLALMLSNSEDAKTLCGKGLYRINKMKETPLPIQMKKEMEKTEAMFHEMLNLIGSNEGMLHSHSIQNEKENSVSALAEKGHPIEQSHEPQRKNEINSNDEAFDGFFTALAIKLQQFAEDHKTYSADAILFEVGCFNIAEIVVFSTKKYSDRAAPFIKSLSSQYIALMSKRLGQDISKKYSERVKEHVRLIEADIAIKDRVLVLFGHIINANDSRDISNEHQLCSLGESNLLLSRTELSHFFAIQSWCCDMYWSNYDAVEQLFLSDSESLR